MYMYVYVCICVSIMHVFMPIWFNHAIMCPLCILIGEPNTFASWPEPLNNFIYF